jgi:glycosyltransferase XagB
MAVSTGESGRSVAPIHPGAMPSRSSSPNQQHTDLLARELPLELAFLAAEGFSPDSLLSAASSAPDAVGPVDQLLNEGKITEETYYRALANHLGCQYYCGDPPLARTFDAVKGLRCGVAPFESRSAGPRMVVAPRAEFVSRLIEATQSGGIRSGSFALTSPQRFASLVRAYHSQELLDVALSRLPTSLTARAGMSGLQIAAIGAISILALVLCIADFGALQAVSSAILWLMFSSSVVLRSMAAIASGQGTHPPDLSDDDLPTYTVVIALYRESSVVEHLVKALDAFDYPALGSKLTKPSVSAHKHMFMLAY